MDVDFPLAAYNIVDWTASSFSKCIAHGEDTKVQTPSILLQLELKMKTSNTFSLNE